MRNIKKLRDMYHDADSAYVDRYNDLYERDLDSSVAYLIKRIELLGQAFITLCNELDQEGEE